MSRQGWAGWLLLLGLAACGGDATDSGAPGDTTSLSPTPSAVPTEEPPAYYGELAALTGALDEANTAGDEALHEALATTEPEDVGDLFSLVTIESAERLEDMIGDARRLSPPSEAAAAHQELIAASRAELAMSRDVAAGLAGLDQEGVEAYEWPADQSEVEGRVDDACLALQALADTAGADVDLCVGMFARPGLG